MPRAIPDATRRKIEEALRAREKTGDSQGKIARRFKVAGSTVNKIAREIGVSFDRSSTQNATAAVEADAERLRSEIMLLGYQRGLAFLKATDTAYKIHSWGDFGRTLYEAEVERPPAADIRHLVGAAKMAIDTAENIRNARRSDNSDDSLWKAFMRQVVGDRADSSYSDEAAGMID
jgi:hypothetical protein